MNENQELFPNDNKNNKLCKHWRCSSIIIVPTTLINAVIMIAAVSLLLRFVVFVLERSTMTSTIT